MGNNQEITSDGLSCISRLIAKLFMCEGVGQTHYCILSHNVLKCWTRCKKTPL